MKSWKIFHSSQELLSLSSRCNLGNNVALKGFTVRTCNANLVAGHTLLCKNIKTGTISRYLSVAVNLLTLAQMMKPTIDIMIQKSQLITDLLHECKRWESMPNRLQPVTKDIVGYLIDKGATKDSDNHYAATADWLILGLQDSFRRME